MFARRTPWDKWDSTTVFHVLLVSGRVNIEETQAAKTYQLVQDFFHQQYVIDLWWVGIFGWSSIGHSSTFHGNSRTPGPNASIFHGGSCWRSSYPTYLHSDRPYQEQQLVEPRQASFRHRSYRSSIIEHDMINIKNCSFGVVRFVHVLIYRMLFEKELYRTEPRFSLHPRSLTASFPLKIDSWKTTFLLESLLFRGSVKLREGISFHIFLSLPSGSTESAVLLWEHPWPTTRDLVPPKQAILLWNLTWNVKNKALEKEIPFWKPSLSGSILDFGGVSWCFFAKRLICVTQLTLPWVVFFLAFFWRCFLRLSLFLRFRSRGRSLTFLDMVWVAKKQTIFKKGAGTECQWG